MNKIFSKIENETNLEIFSTKITYLNNKFYVICKNVNNKYFIIQYNLKNSSIKSIEIDYFGQDIISDGERVYILSTSKNKIYIKVFNETLNLFENNEIGNIEIDNLDEFDTNLLYSKFMSYNNMLLFSLGNDIKFNDRKIYIFDVDKGNYNLIGMKEFSLKDKSYSIYGNNLYVN